MAYEDYSNEEIQGVVDWLLDIHYSKLMSWEITALEQIKVAVIITQQNRDWLVGLYDRIGESNY